MQLVIYLLSYFIVTANCRAKQTFSAVSELIIILHPVLCQLKTECFKVC